MRILKLLTLMVIIQDIKTTNTCPNNCTCQQTVVSCKGSRNRPNILDIPTTTTRLSLCDMDLFNDTKLKGNLENLVDLKELNLTDNKFEHIPFETIKCLTNLSTLILRSNNIRNLSPNLLELSRKDLTIHLDDNELICNCETLYILDQLEAKVNGYCTQPFQQPLQNLTQLLLECDPCKGNANKCLFGGQCVAVNIANFTCNCLEGFTGDFCERPIDTTPQKCKQNICQNGGTCFESDKTNFTCQCPSNAEGIRCETLNEDPTSGSDTAIVVGIAIAMAFLILVAIVTWYMLRLRPRKRIRRRNRESGSSNHSNHSNRSNGKTNNRQVQFASINEGYSQEKAKAKAKKKESEKTENPYPHDPAHGRWLGNRRRCSTVLEGEEGSCVEETAQDKYNPSLSEHA